jgi:hypothetical protein
MERRNFLKFLGLAAVTPKVAVEVLSKIQVPAATPIVVSEGAGARVISSEEMTAHLKRIYAPAIQDWFHSHSMTYEMFAKESKKHGVQSNKKGYYFNLSKPG